MCNVVQKSTHDGILKSRVINIPAFMDAKNLQPPINRDLSAVIKKIEYIDKISQKT